MRATVGLHPARGVAASTRSGPSSSSSPRSPGVVAIGEAGFDLHYHHSEPDAQEVAFRAQIELATELERALVIHSREAWDETLARPRRRRARPPRTVFHCFTGGPDEAAACLALGAHLSFSGIVSFKTADDVRAAAAACPLDRMLVETDAPYLAPVPHRGRENEPALVGRGRGGARGGYGTIGASDRRATVANSARVLETPSNEGLP